MTKLKKTLASILASVSMLLPSDSREAIIDVPVLPRQSVDVQSYVNQAESGDVLNFTGSYGIIKVTSPVVIDDKDLNFQGNGKAWLYDGSYGLDAI